MQGKQKQFHNQTDTQKMYQMHCDNLGINYKQAKIFQKLKSKYGVLIRKNTLNPSKRKVINAAYEYLCNQIFQIVYNPQESMLIAAIIDEDIQKLKKILDMNKDLINFRIKGGYPLVYLAVRSGSYKTTELILKMGCSLDFSKDKSTPMHCAAFYGHRQIITLLLQYGIPIKIKNFANKIPEQESATPEIKSLLQNSHKNQVHSLISQLIYDNQCATTFNIEVEGKVIAKKIVLNPYFRDLQQFVDTFHGTSFQNFPSIAKHGLKKPGDHVDGNEIKIVKGHFQEDRYYDNTQNWGVAVFVSPSIYYASHPCYSKQFINNTDQVWLPIVQARVKKGSYTMHGPTTRQYKHAINQPENVEYRVQLNVEQNKDGDKSFCNDIKDKIVVVSFILLKKGYLQTNSNYNQVLKLLLDSQVEQKLKQNMDVNQQFSKLTVRNDQDI